MPPRPDRTARGPRPGRPVDGPRPSGPSCSPDPSRLPGPSALAASSARPARTYPWRHDIGHHGGTLRMTQATRWGTDFDPDRLAALETRMWKAYYRRQPARLFVTLIEALRAQARVSWPRALAASLLLTRAAAGFARATGDYERFAPDIGRAYRLLGLPDHVDAEAVARHELRCGSSAARSAWPPAPWPASRSPTCTQPCTTSRASASRRRAGCADSQRRSVIAARPRTRTVRAVPGAPTGPRSPGSCEPPTAASRPGSQPTSRCSDRHRRPRRDLPPSGRPGDGRPATRRSGRVRPPPPAWPRPRRRMASGRWRPWHRRSCP